jgi:hypothetical protein
LCWICGFIDVLTHKIVEIVWQCLQLFHLDTFDFGLVCLDVQEQ